MRIVIPPLPEGWAGSPDDLIEYINENQTIETDGESSGAFVPGQIRGPKPISDVGIWFSDDSIEIFRDGVYHPISDIPVGAMVVWPAPLSTAPPANWLFCDGRSIVREDYPDLFTALGVSWGSESPETFSLPNPNGRYPLGSGHGDYDDNQGQDKSNGQTPDRQSGLYTGRGWIRKEPSYASMPTGGVVKSLTAGAIISPTGQQYVSVEPPAFVINWIIRYR